MVMIGMTLKWWKMIVSNLFCILHICTLLGAVTVSNVTENGDIFVGHMSCCSNIHSAKSFLAELCLVCLHVVGIRHSLDRS